MKKKMIILTMASIMSFGSFKSVFANTSYPLDAEVSNTDMTQDYGIQSCSTSYDYTNYEITGINSLSTYIQLSSSQPYGKAFFTNNSSDTIRLTVSGVESIEIEPNESGSIKWKKGIFTKQYDVDIYCSTKNLNGTFSLAKSDKEF